MGKPLEDTQAFSLTELERRGRSDREISLSSPNLAPAVNAAEVRQLQEQDQNEGAAPS